MFDDDFKRQVEAHFHEQRLFNLLIIRGYLNMTAALDRLTASSQALIDQSAATDAELGAVVDEMKTLAGAMTTDDSAALTALADKLDASRGNSKTAADAAAAALAEVNGAATTSGADTTTNTVTAPVAVVSTDPAVIQQAPGDTAPTAVIVTDHPSDGTTLVTPVTSTDPVSAGSITVDPTTGVPTADASSGVTLGETTVAPSAPSTAADHAAADPSAVVSATA